MKFEIPGLVLFIQGVSGLHNSLLLYTDHLKMALWVQKVSGGFKKWASGTVSFRQCCNAGSLHGIIIQKQMIALPS